MTAPAPCRPLRRSLPRPSGAAHCSASHDAEHARDRERGSPASPRSGDETFADSYRPRRAVELDDRLPEVSDRLQLRAPRFTNVARRLHDPKQIELPGAPPFGDETDASLRGWRDPWFRGSSPARRSRSHAEGVFHLQGNLSLDEQASPAPRDPSPRRRAAFSPWLRRQAGKGNAMPAPTKNWPGRSRSTSRMRAGLGIVSRRSEHQLGVQLGSRRHQLPQLGAMSPRHPQSSDRRGGRCTLARRAGWSGRSRYGQGGRSAPPASRPTPARQGRQQTRWRARRPVSISASLRSICDAAPFSTLTFTAS